MASETRRLTTWPILWTPRRSGYIRTEAATAARKRWYRNPLVTTGSLDPELRDALAQAVGEGVPPRFVRVADADLSDDGDAAVVLVVLNPNEDPYPRLSFCEHVGGVWRELAEADPTLPAVNWAAGRWVAYAGGSAPAGASVVSVRHGDETRERPVVDGLYVAAFWASPGGSEDDPPNPPDVIAWR